MLGIKEIKEIIPHRHPFLLVDCIEELEPACGLLDIKQSHIMSRIFPAISRRSR